MSRRRSATGPPFRGPIRWELVPKPGGDVRRLVVLTPADQLAFARERRPRDAGHPSGCRTRIAREPDRRVGPGPRARHGAVDPGEDAVAARRPPSGERPPVRRRDGCAGLLRLDLADRATRRLTALGAPETCVDEIASWLRAFEEVGVEGLPVGPAVSAVLADAVLSAATMRSAARARRTSAGSTTWRSSRPTRGREPSAPGAPPGLGVVRPGAPRREDRAVRRSGGRRHVRSDPSDARPRAPRCDNRAT